MTRIGILGFGEAGSAFAETLVAHGANVAAFDKDWGKSAIGRTPCDDDSDAGIRLCAFPSDLLASADIVLSTVTTDTALDAARACLPGLTPHHTYCDLNSTAPATKVELDRLIAPTGAKFVEGAIMGAIGVTGGRTKILLGGSHAQTLAETLNGLGLQTSPYSEEIGKASTFKLLRSVFSKGIEALVIEFLLAGRKAGLADDLWREVVTLFDENDFGEVTANWVRSHAVAHERRFHEMVQVAALLDQLKVDAIMTQAALAVFRRSTELGLSNDFRRKPERIDDVPEALIRRMARSAG